MSGHSHYSTIKRQKESRDAARGKIFSKLTRAIQIAVKTGGSPDPDINSKLRMAIESARASNMPKDNIKRAIDKGKGSGNALEEVSYEGIGPKGVSIVVEVATDNRNRAGQEIKNLFERGGGSLAGPGSVLYNFENKGLVVVKKVKDSEKQMLDIIEAGAEDIQETDTELEVYVAPDKLSKTKEDISKMGYSTLSFEIIKKPKNLQVIDNDKDAQKILSLLESFENYEDVQKVYANIDIPGETLAKLKLERN